MALTSNQLTRYETGFNKAFSEGAADVSRSSLWGQLAQVPSKIPSSKGVEDYRWLSNVPEFSEWVGERKIASLKDYHYFIQNEKFQASVQIPEDDLDDDSFGLYAQQVRALPSGVETKWGKLVHKLLASGKTAKAFDGVPFFSAATGGRKLSNLLTGTMAATPTLDQVRADVNSVRVAMAQFKDENGDPLGIVPDVFIVHPAAELVFRQLFNSTADVAKDNSGVANPFQNAGTVIVDPGIEKANSFFALATRGYSVGAIVRQERDNVAAELFDDHFMNKRYIYGADFRGNVGFGFPQLAVAVEGK